MNIAETMIDACHRLGKGPGPNKTPPGSIVKFVRRYDKEQLLLNRRVKSSFSPRHMNMTADQPVYINEALSLVEGDSLRRHARPIVTNNTSSCG